MSRHHDNTADPRSSVLTYASTHASDEDLATLDRYSPSERTTVYQSKVVPSTPADFAELFPSTREFLICHDDSTDDGNMNLRVDTELTTTRGQRLKMCLFHLRMTNLQERKFSLRRYCRNSGREVCHSARKYTKPALPHRVKRPSMTRSMSSALYSLGKKALDTAHLSDSGYESYNDDVGIEEDLREFTALSEVKATIPTDAIRLEFSNYAQVEIHRCATRSGKAYMFEYWGTLYQWQRDLTQCGLYRLVDLAASKVVARIVPEPLGRREALEEELQGSWVPPCSLRITDRSIANESKTDLNDVIVATGLVSLVDECIKRRWHSALPHQPKRSVTSDHIAHRARGYTETRR